MRFKHIKRMGYCVAWTIGLLWALCIPTAANGYYTNGQIVIATEPEEVSRYLEYYVDGEPASSETLTWVENGHTGKGLSLNGENQYLKLGKQITQVRTFTFAGWFLWNGSADAQDAQAGYNQHLFTIAKKQDNWLTFSPYMQDTDKQLNGAYLGYKRGETVMELFKPAEQGVCYAVPTGQWHHIAVVVSEQQLCLYIDATLYLSVPAVTYVGDLNADGLYIGWNPYQHPLLHAVLDDMYIFEYDLTAEQIGRLYHGIDLSDTETPLPTQPAFSRPTAVTTTMPMATGAPLTAPQTFFSGETGIFNLPLWGLRFILYIVGTVAVLSVLFSICEIIRRRKPKH